METDSGKQNGCIHINQPQYHLHQSWKSSEVTDTQTVGNHHLPVSQAESKHSNDYSLIINIVWNNAFDGKH